MSFNNFVNGCELTDVWRSFHNDKKCFTWIRGIPMIARRLDYVFTNDVMYEQIVDLNILVYQGSDHDIVEIQASFIKYERGPGYWKLNASYLDNDDYTRMIENVIQEIIDDYKNKLERFLRKKHTCGLLGYAF